MTIVADRVRETTTTTGTGAVTLAGAQPGFRTFLTALGAGSTDVYYCIADTTPNNWEVGLGTYVSSTNTLSRTSVYASSNANALVSFGSGTKDVYITVPTTLLNTYATKTGTETLDNKTLSSLNTGPLAGFRNKIINGKMDVAQRGTSFSSGGYCLDRWYFTSGGTGAYTVTQAAGAGPNNNLSNCLRVTVNTADAAVAVSDFLYIDQAIEGYNSRDLIGNTFTISFWIKSSKTGIHCAAIRNTGATWSYVVEYTVIAANTWEYKTITISGGLSTGATWDQSSGVGMYINFTLMAGSNFQATANTWTNSNKFATANQVNVADTINNTFNITGVQIEIGASATPFENRPIGVELDLCYRYYWQSGPVASSAQQTWLGVVASSTILDYFVTAPVNMRIIPTSVTTSSWSWSTSTFTGGQVGAYNYTSAGYITSTHTSIGLSNVGNNSIYICLRLTGTGGSFSGTSGNVLQFTAGPSVWFGFSAEL